MKLFIIKSFRKKIINLMYTKKIINKKLIKNYINYNNNNTNIKHFFKYLYYFKKKNILKKVFKFFGYK